MSTQRQWIKPIAIGLAALAIAGAGYLLTANKPAAPNVTFVSITGEKIAAQSLRGKVVMVNFWATSCATCVKEMPQMVETYEKFKGRGMEFVAVAMSYDRPDYVLAYTDDKKLPFKVALDVDGSLAKQFGNVAMTPTTFVIDKDGKILKRYVGEPEFPALHALLDKAISG
ncbi:peroxiredoxin [Massilia sp. TS11]|uniref:peroxiredoxin family protein n=1 Tax=Massilia sp. TS11 TaxID=2908003 RepID=UPI001EDAF7D4|nr:TlpA disulfide reductase family protein [Massilia sp. TS11]MCG2585181.1 TlpA family protein disulfide reductase [Massilia sp. TS11]